jgi:RHS repeat-associated protein
MDPTSQEWMIPQMGHQMNAGKSMRLFVFHSSECLTLTCGALGNRLTRTDSSSVPPPPVLNGTVMGSTYDVANRMLTSPDTTYTYDNNGNTLTKTDASGTTTYGYDYENRLISASMPGGIVATYTYDPFGRRISKSVNGVTTQYLYDGMNIIKEYDGTGTLLASYVHGPGIDEPISMTRGGQTFYYHADGLGSITGLTDSSQTVVQNYGYDGFGNLTQTPTIQNPYTYTGREWDRETGLYYYRARYYDPQTGRFLTEDPIGFAGGDVNLYGYVWNNPVKFTDPSGNYGFVGAGYGVVAGSIGGYIGSGGTISGAVVGGIVGGIVGFVNPFGSGYVGTFVGGMVASFAGQAAGIAQKCGLTSSAIINWSSYNYAAAFGAGVGGVGGRFFVGAKLGKIFYGTESIMTVFEGMGAGSFEFAGNLAYPASTTCGCN